MELAQVASDAGLGVKQLGTILGWTAAVIFGSGLLILLFRVTLEGTPKNQRRDISSVVDTTTIRSWLAISLISGLLIFGAASFVLDGASELRNLLMGGIIASAGTATAFYFASKTSEQTQQNLLNAAFGAAGPIKLPKVAGMTVGNARTVLQALGLTLQTDPADAADERVIKATDPTADSPAKLGDKITATLEPVVVDAAAVDFLVPNLVGMTVGEGRTVLQALGLTLQTDPADAADERVIKATDPTADSPAKAGDKITATLEPVVVDAAAVDFPVPNLVGMTVGEGRTVLQALGLTLQTDPADAADERVIKATDPTADSPAKAGDKITVTLADE